MQSLAHVSCFLPRNSKQFAAHHICVTALILSAESSLLVLFKAQTLWDPVQCPYQMLALSVWFY